MSAGYYEKLSAERLRRCYEIAPPRVRQYLHAELAHAAAAIEPGSLVLDLGCGFGRAFPALQARARCLVGIDNSHESLLLARQEAGGAGCLLAGMDAGRLGFADSVFDAVVCLQNGISAFAVDRRALLAEAVRVTRRQGKVLFSSYAAGFWTDRLAWFRLQADAGLIGPIDETATGGGVIVCRDGFRAETVGPEEFRSLAAGLDLAFRLTEVDGSSLFLEATVR